MVSVDVKHHVYLLVLSQSPCEIKRREVSWTLTKKLDTFVGPGEIKRREVVLDSHEEVRHFCGSRRDQEVEGGAGPTS